jgi:hypothetical protein
MALLAVYLSKGMTVSKMDRDSALQIWQGKVNPAIAAIGGA